MLEIKARKIKLSEVFILSKILKDMNIKSYLEYLVRQMARNDKELKKNMKDKSDKDQKELKNENNRALGIDVFAFLIENIELSQDSFYKLIGSYSEITEDEAKNLDLDDVFKIFETMYKNGLPNVITSLVKKNFLPEMNILKT